ncbi:hypothetical protein JW824_14450 [bacterium]|nr:hypothetical protein [bacterium]
MFRIKTIKRYIVQIIVLCIFYIQNIQGEWALDAAPKFGNTRALSMGGVTIASGTGADAFSGNPGGLARINETRIFISGGLQLWGRMRYDHSLKPLFQFHDFGIVFPSSSSNQTVSFAGAIGYRSFYDCDRKMKRSYYTNTTTGLVDVLSMGAGAYLFNVASFGVMLHVPVRTTYIYKSETVYYTNYEYKRDVSSSVIVQFGGIVDLTSRWLVGFSYLLGHSYRMSGLNYNYSEDREIPWTCDFGTAYRLKPDLLIAADIQNRPWERVRINDQKINNVKSGNAYRIGIEWGNRPVFRAGYALDILPILDAEGNPVDINNLTAGLGFKFSILVIDLGLSYQFDHIHKENNIHELVFNMTVTCSL